MKRGSVKSHVEYEKVSDFIEHFNLCEFLECLSTSEHMNTLFVTIYLLSFSLEYSQHILKNHRSSLKQVFDDKNIVNSYQLFNRQFRRKQLVGKLL